MAIKMLIAEKGVRLMKQVNLALQLKMDNISIHLSKDYNEIFAKIIQEGYDFLILSFKTPVRENKI
ncbi:hypothetical protein CMT37_05160 [Elizabethkingia anophelis]|nr:hypothetical protein [Elizabethkingia anophelis]